MYWQFHSIEQETEVTMYVLPEFKKNSHTVVLGLDPGSKNMGISAVAYSKKTGKGKVLANAVMHSPVKGLVKGLAERRDAFCSELELWINHFGVRAIIAERFQSRGLMGTTVEEISMMLGMTAMLAKAHEIPFKVITAATWKNKFNRRHDLNLKDLYINVCVPPHQLDATLIGFFGIEYGLDLEIPYTIPGLVSAVEKASVTKLINRVSRRGTSDQINIK